MVKSSTADSVVAQTLVA